MRVVLDTNILVSALLLESSLPAQVLTYWRRGRFQLLTAKPQFEELYRVTRYPTSWELTQAILALNLATIAVCLISSSQQQ